MVGVHMKMATTKQTGGRYSGGPDSPAMTDYISGHPSGRFLPVAISLMGTVVKVQTKENKHYEGVFKAFSPQFDIALEVVHPLESGREDELPRQSTVVEKMIFELKDIVKIEGTPDLESVVKSGFATDAEISSRANNGTMEMTRELEPWMPDAGCDDDHLASENNGPLSDGWSVEDMFAVNQDRFSIRSDYDEKLYHTADLDDIDPNSEAHRAMERRAHEIAREIERNPASKRAADLENDDEERDIVVKSSGSSANNSTATTPTSTTASGARYVPPNKRPGGSNRGARRGGGSGAQYQPTIRNQGGGDGRGPVRGPPRDYPDPSTHPLSSGFYQQRPANRFGHQPQQPHHHQIVAQTSHERSPTGPGQNNEWERARGPKRDGRENHGGPFSMPPVTSVPQTARPMSMMPPRQSLEGVGPNERRKKVEEFKKFNQDFQLVSEPPGRMPQGSVVAGSPAVSATASSSNQSSRLPPQSSPTQSQLPPPPMAMAPPQSQQRRSPELKGQPAPSYAMAGHQTGPPHHAPHHHHHHPNQNQQKQISPGQAQPPSLPPPMVRPEVPPRMEAMYQQQQVQQAPPPHLSQQHPSDYSNPPHVHQQPQRPNHPSMMVMQGPQTGNNGGPPHAPKMTPMAGHVPPQLPPMVINQPPPPPSLSQPPPSQTPQQQQQQPSQPHSEQEQRSTEAATDTIKKSKLNPEAAEFRPQFRSASTAPPATMVPIAPNAAMGSYPMVQSPPQTPLQQNPNAVYGGVSAGGPVASGGMYVGTAQGAYPQQQPHSSGALSVQILPGAAPLYNIAVQGNQPAVALISSTPAFRPRTAQMAVQPQQTVAAATGQPIMTGPYPQTQYTAVLYNAPVHQPGQPHPGMPAGAAYPPNPAYVMNANRMMAPQYILPQAPGSNEQSQQQFYATVPPMAQVGPGGGYPQAASVPSVMHQSGPGAPQFGQQQQQQQQQNNGNNNHSQTPPTSQPQQSQSTNPTSAAGPPPPSNAGNVPGTGSMNVAPVIPYPPSAPTPQSPQYPTTPVGPPGAYQTPYVFVPAQNYMATAVPYSNQAGVAPGAVHIHNAAAVHHAYSTTQPQFVAPDVAAHYAAVAAAQQAAVVHQHMSHANPYHPAMMRSSSASSYVPNGPVVTAASGQGNAPMSHQNNHS